MRTEEDQRVCKEFGKGCKKETESMCLPHGPLHKAEILMGFSFLTSRSINVGSRTKITSKVISELCLVLCLGSIMCGVV